MVKWLRKMMVLVFAVVSCFLYGCSNNGPSDKEVIKLSQQCIVKAMLSGLMENPNQSKRIDSTTTTRKGCETKDLSIVNRYSKKLGGETVYGYAIKWRHDGGSTIFDLEVVARGEALVIMKFNPAKVL